MSWLNFNESLNSIKGQISNFANNVLAEDEGEELSGADYKKLQELCQQQEFEILNLKQLLQEYDKKQNKSAEDSNESWTWNENEGTNDSESLSNLKKNLSKLEKEKAELVTQLDQLDADNQENLLNIMRMKEKLQSDYNDLNEKYIKTQEENKSIKDELDKIKSTESLAINKEESNSKLNHEVEELKKELFVIKSANENLQKIIEETKRSHENENKLLYSELKKANEQIKFFEKKSVEDEDNCQKLAFILETYETQVSNLKIELEEITNKYKETKKECKEIEKVCNQLKAESNNIKSDKIIEELKKEIENLKGINEDLLKSKRFDADLEKELDSIKEEHEEQLNTLREELEELKKQETKVCNKEITDQYEELKLKYADLNKILDEKNDKLNKCNEEIDKLKKNNEELNETKIKFLEKELDNLRKENEEQIKLLQEKEDNYNEELNTYEKEINDLKKVNEELLNKANGRLDIDLDNELESIKEDYETQLNILRDELEQLKAKENDNDEKINKNKTEIDDLKILNEEISKYKKEIEDLKKVNEDLLAKANGRMDIDLEDELETIKEEHETQLNILREELEQLKEEEQQNVKDNKKYDELEEEKLEIIRELNDLKQQCEYIQNNNKIGLNELHNKYINIITENIKKFQECEKPSDFENCIKDEDPLVAELNKHIEDIIKILLELKYKSAELEKRIIKITEEKNTILVEKNHEIEKLIQNSDMLSQEIVTKIQTIKEYENECTELAKNNELLINELETLKNNPGLQTISESNEDNMILLESQLENANRRINDLEKIIDELKKEKSKNGDEDNTDKSKTVVEKLKDYNTLLNSYDQLQILYESNKKELEETNNKLSELNENNLNLQSNYDKLKSEYELFEYQITELNVNSDTLKDEIEEFKTKFNTLMTENSKIKLENEDIVKKSNDYILEIDNLKEKLTKEEEIKKEFEEQIEIITEKLKNNKMSETSLKLQYEQKNKELAAQSEARYNLELSLVEFQNNFIELQTQYDKLQIENENLSKELQIKEEKIKELYNKLEDSTSSEEQLKKMLIDLKDTKDSQLNGDSSKLKQILDETVLEKANLHAQLTKLTEVQSQLKEATDKCAILHQQLQEVTNSRNELINMVTMKHQENVTYHNEIQRLNQVLTTEVEKYKNLEKKLNDIESSKEIASEKEVEIERLTDQNNFLKEKCEVLAKNLLEEQSKVQQLLSERTEKESSLQKKLDRLQAHLIEMEEHYTEELFQVEQKNQDLKSKLLELEEREKNSSTMYTSVSIRANQQVESLQKQLQSVIQERDSLRKQISDAEDENTKQAAALANLQFVLEQFRKDKEKDVIKETERIRRHINTEKQIQEELRAEIASLKSQLEERNQGLLAASRISDQLESSKKTVAGLKEEVSQLQSKLSKTEEELKNTLSSTDGKVDKLLVKNLIIGLVTCNNNLNRDQTQILKIIATVLDFNQQDHDKVKLNQPQQGWLSSFLAPHPDNQAKMSEESLSRAFIKFLENESKPREVPSLLNTTLSESSSTKTTNSRSTTPGQTPIVLSEIVLPTFTDFAQNRNSSSILKDVLKDNS